MKFFLLIFIAAAIFFIWFLIGISIKKRRMEKIKKQMEASNGIVVQPRHPPIPFENAIWRNPSEYQNLLMEPNKPNKIPPFPKSTIHRESEMPKERPRKSLSIVSDPDAALTPWDFEDTATFERALRTIVEDKQDPNEFITKPDPEDHSHHFSGGGSSGGWVTSDDSRNNFSGASSDNDGGSFGGSSYVIDDGSSGGGSSSFDSGSSSSSDW